MTRLALSDLMDNKAIWVGLFIMAVLCGYLGSWAVSIESTASQFQNLSSLGSVVMIFSAVAAVAVLIPLAQQVVLLQAKTYALWQIVGVPPRTISAVVLVQLFLVSVPGAALGSLFEVVSYPLLFPWVFSSYDPPQDIAYRFGVEFMPLLWIGIGALFIVGGFRAARRAAKISPVVALREPEELSKSISAVRAVACVALAGATVWYAIGLSGYLHEREFEYAMFAPVLVTAAVSAFAPLVFPALLKLVRIAASDRYVPAFIASRSSLYQVETAGSPEVAIMVGYGMMAAFFAISDTLGAYVDGIGMTGLNTSLDFTSALLLFGGPVALSCAGAAIASFLSFGRRRSDVALLASLGVPEQGVVKAAFIESVIHVAVAATVGALLALIACALVGGVVGEPLVLLPALTSSLVVPAIGLALTFAAILIPTLAGLRGGLRRE